MGKEQQAAHLTSLREEVREIWNRNAAFWDRRMGEGNDFHRVLVAPAQERLLGLRPGEEVLDVACGNGQFSRWMARQGARVVAFDAAAEMVRRAVARTDAEDGRIEYRVLDATDRSQLETLGRGRFDAAVCVMAMMDMPVLEPLMSFLADALKDGGRFVFSVIHPAFNSPWTRLAAEEVVTDREVSYVPSVRVFDYLSTSASKGVAMVGQPVAQYYFHRPLAVLFGACFRAGFVLDGVEEPAFPTPLDAGRPLAWSQFQGIPPVLAARMRLLRRFPGT